MGFGWSESTGFVLKSVMGVAIIEKKQIRERNGSMKQTAILFDIDDTLYDQVVPFGKAVKKVFPGFVGASDETLFKRRAYHSEVSFRMNNNGQMTMQEMYRYRVQKTFAEFGLEVSDEDAMAFQVAYEESQGQLELSSTMEQMLDDCKERGVILGIISNGPADHQMEKARTMQMSRWIPEEWTIVSGAVGILKPDVRIFRLTEERMGLDPETMDIWYVGDSFPNDMVGAAGAGWKTIWLNRRGKSVPEGTIVPDMVVNNDEELYHAIQGLLGD